MYKRDIMHMTLSRSYNELLCEQLYFAGKLIICAALNGNSVTGCNKVYLCKHFE